jgi:hypothetical protein
VGKTNLAEKCARLRDWDWIIIVNNMIIVSIVILVIVIVIYTRTAGRALAAAMSFGRISDGRDESIENVLTVASTYECVDVEQRCCTCESGGDGCYDSRGGVREHD